MSDNWRFDPLEELATITMGQSPDASAVNENEIGLPFLQGCAEFGDRHPMAKAYCFPPLRIAKRKSTLISVRAPVGTTNNADQDYCIGRGLGSVLAKPDQADNAYLSHAIEHEVAYLHRRSQGSTFLAISSGDLRSLPIPAPGINVQRRIAEILTTIDETIEQTEALIAKTQRIKAGLMHDIFARGVTENGELRPPRSRVPHIYKESPLGWIPKEWDCVKLGDYIGRIDSGWSPNCESEAAEDGQWGVLKTTAVVWDGYCPTENKKLIPGTITFEAITTKVGDLLITRKGPVDRVGVVVFVPNTPPNLMFPDTVFRTRLLENQRTTPEFMALAMGSPSVQKYWWQRKVGLADAQVNLNHKILRATPIMIPPTIEQDSICKSASTAMSSMSELKSTLNKLKSKKQGLMHDLLTGRVRVPEGAVRV